MKLFAGADVGGSHTAVAVGPSPENVLARAEGPGAAVKPGLAPASAAIIAEVTRRALSQAGHGGQPVEALLVGAAGAGRAPEQEALHTALVKLGAARRVKVMPDGEVSLYAAFGEGAGIVVAAGTGSVAFGRTPDGTVHRAGGLGWQVGDEGSGYWIGREALRLGLSAVQNLVAENATVAEVAALAPLVIRAAAQGDVAAKELIDAAARELAQLARALADRFPGGVPVPVAAAGGLLGPASLLRTRFSATLVQEVPRARVVDGPVDAARGALALAARLA